VNCLEDHYGSLENCLVEPGRAETDLRAIQAEMDKVKDLL